VILARITGAHLHVAHLSTAGGVAAVRAARAAGIKVTCEVTPHHIALTDEALQSFSTNLKMNPPLRSRDHVEAVIEGVVDGTVDAIATDHAPHHFDEKNVEFDLAPFGIIGLETALAMIVTNLVETGILSYSQMVERMSCSPARVFKLPGGSLARGAAADVTVFDPAASWTVDPTRFLSKGRNTPYAGMTLRGKAVCTIVAGRVVYRP